MTLFFRSLYFDILSSLGIILGKNPLCGPRTLQLNICDSCNLDCIMCNHSCMPVGGAMPFERVIRTVEEVYGIGLREIFFHGYGEPFMHPRILEIFDEVSDRFPGLRQFTVTNGTFLDEPTVAGLVRNRVGVRVSLHAGESETWSRINPSLEPGMFDKVERGIRSLAARQPENLEILFVIMRENYDRIEGMAEFALKNQVKTIIFRPMRLYNDAEGKVMNNHLLLSRDQHQEAAAKIEEIKKSTNGRLAVDSAPFEMSSYTDHLGRPSSAGFYQSNVCLLGWVFSLILKDGTVLGCLEESFDTPMGNVYESPFREIWWSNNYKRFRKQQLFQKGESFQEGDCRTWCQHLRTNRRLNHIRKARFIRFLRDRRSGEV